MDETWLTAIPDFEHRLNSTNARKRVKAARDLSEVTEGLRIVVCFLIIGLTLSKSMRWISEILLGSNENTDILFNVDTTHPCEYDYEYASYSDICVDQVQSSL